MRNSTQLRLFFVMVLYVNVALHTSNIYAQSAVKDNGVNLKLGIISSIFNPNKGALIHQANNGFSMGLEGVFSDGNLIIQPGAHVLIIPRQYTALKSMSEKPFERLRQSPDLVFKVPARANIHIINTPNFKIKAGAGLLGLFCKEGIHSEFANNRDKKHYVAGGYTLNAGIMLRPLIVEIDYDNSFGNVYGKGPWYFKAVSLTAGFFF